MRELLLTKGKVALIDDDIYDEISKYKWCYFPCGYAARGATKNGKNISVYMHRQIMNAPKGQMVDHKDGNSLNNLRENLRLCKSIQNQRNSKIPKNNTSGFKGVTWYKPSKRWRAQITLKNQCIYLGYFIEKIDAAKAYNEAAKELFGEFSKLNKIS